MPKIKTTLGDWIEALSSEGATPEEIASRYGEQYESLSPKDLKGVTSPELDVARSQSANVQKYGPGFVKKFSEPLENIRQSQEASKMSGFGEFAEAEKDINKTRALIDDLTPSQREAIANAYKQGSTGKELMNMFMNSKVGKLASGTAELAGKGIGIAGRAAEPLIAYSSGKEFLQEIQKSPEFLSMSPDEQREYIAKVTGSLGETVGAGIGTAATGGQLLAGGIGSGTLAAAAAPFVAPAAGLTGTAMLSKYMGPHLAKGAEEASAMPGGTMASRLGGDPNAENPDIASGSAPLSAMEKQEVEKLFGKNRTDNPFMMAGEEEKKPTALDLQEAPSSAKEMISREASVPSAQKEMQDFVNLEKQQGADYAKRLEEAERKARENEALGLASKAISQIAGGIAQTKAKADLGKVDTSIADEFLKTSGKPLEELKRSIEMEKDDPNSAASKSIRAIAQRELKNIGMNIDLGNMSYAQIKNIFPEIERRAERLETAKYRQQALSVAKAGASEEKKRATDLRIENQVNKRFDTNMKEDIGRLESVKRVDALISAIESGALVDSNNVRNILTNDIAVLATPTGGRGTTLADREKTAINTLSTKIKDILQYVTSNPQSTIPSKFVKQLKTETQVLNDKYVDSFNRKLSSLKKGTKDEYAKSVLEGRAEPYLNPGYEQQDADKEALDWAKNKIKSGNAQEKQQASEILKLNGIL